MLEVWRGAGRTGDKGGKIGKTNRIINKICLKKSFLSVWIPYSYMASNSQGISIPLQN